MSVNVQDLPVKELLTLQRLPLIAASAVILYVLYIVIDQVVYFFFPRQHAIPQSYPFEPTLEVLRNQHQVLEMLWKYIDLGYGNYQKKTMVINAVGLPTLVVTTDVDNVTHILKGNFDNYGKGGVFKPRMQGLLGDGIFNADGHQWFAHRKTSAHLFKMNKFKGSILDVFNDDLNQLIGVMNSRFAGISGNNRVKAGEVSGVMDIHDLMHRFTLESISRVAFGIALGCIHNQSVNFAKDFDYCTMMINDSFLNPLWYLERYFTPKGWKYFAALRRIDAYAKKIITERRKEVESGADLEGKNDLLTLYLDNKSFADILGANKEKAASSEGKAEELDAFMEPTDKNLRDVILNMVIAGRDTTAQALSWAFYRMCVHPETQKKIRAEVQSVFAECMSSNGTLTEKVALEGSDGIGAVSFDTLQKLKYLEAFIMEVLRFHPSVPKEAKFAFKDDTLPDGTKIFKGDLVTFMPWIMGRDKDLWGEDALEFKPERFLDQPKPSPFKFIAFQAGPRTCLGQNFAMLEMKCVLSRLLFMYSFELAQSPESVTYDNSLTLPIKGGLKVKAQKLF